VHLWFNLAQVAPKGFLVRAMTGTILNVVGIVVGSILGLRWVKQMTPRRQMMLKAWLGILAVIVGLLLVWKSLGGNVWSILRQMLILVLALTFGRLAGKAVGVQKILNRAGDFAKRRMADAQETREDAKGSTESRPTNKGPTGKGSKESGSAGTLRPARKTTINEGFVTCTVLFCFAPLAVIGPVLEGIGGYWQPLGIKAVMDGLGAMAFVNIFGRGVLLSALPVLAWQGTISILARWAAPFLWDHNLALSIIGVGGLLLFSVSLVILEIKRIELGDYLPSLIFAPLLAWLWW
jgi:uncharacterized protein